ncbi:DUF2254 domain-containing protein [Microbacterium sp. AK031]|uniref:DUF2254 domain-containing protein n=1 Tax=Microbacterium sp. AK031 TaxID=2723076 RepID=UPI002169BEC1|nr:DUF2254 domain-containing protein [Microbacterium sp. AK031]MCS3842937.1 putative membrane protein [Microbacterium sp. AK031]
MTSNIRVLLRRLGKKVWARAALVTAVSIVFVLAAGWVGTLFPFMLVIDLGQDSVGSILQIIATSMLAVTTFSITAMVTAYSSATTTATPRATQLLVEDPTSQNALSTFVGGFTFSLVGIIALSTGYYGDQGRTILFLGTLIMVAIIVVTLLRWIAHLSTFGRMADIIDRVEAAASTTLNAYAASPSLGARTSDSKEIIGESVPSHESGYVTFVDVAALERIASRLDCDIHVLALAGRYADTMSPLAVIRSATALDSETRKAVVGTFRIEAHRTYEQDPRLGMIALAEIGSRALSPSTNDPGTAIEILSVLQRILSKALQTDPDAAVKYPHIWIRPVALSDLIVDAFRPISRDGAGIIEVQIRLQKCLASLAATAPQHAHLFAMAADRAHSQTLHALSDEERRELDGLRRTLWH